ncbi:MAG: triose-phosphate isomerase [Chloroflexota bacterium]|nr:triose-phosphate isomerase [Chloroflexota bacterium]
MRIPLIAGNWKMNTTVEEAEKLALDMRAQLDRIEGVEKVLCPPFISLAPLWKLLKGSSIKLGAQNMHFEAKGAYTGEISPLMLKKLCQFVILGHSERRWYFGERNELINSKVKAAMANELKPILCVGERLEENEAGRAKEIISRQINQGLNNVTPTYNIVIAYEPVWAIGTGKAASGEQAATTIKFIRDTLVNLWNEDTARDIRILYGGSVTSNNIAEFISQTEIDGALVGGASLKTSEFSSIIQQAASIKRTSTASQTN